MESALRRRGLHAHRCVDGSSLLRDAAAPGGALLLTEEALGTEFLASLRDLIDAQPPWSDLPILLLTSGQRSPQSSSAHLVRLAGERGNVTLLERPIRMDTLASVVKSALRSRRHQYEIRDHLIDRQRKEETYRETAKLEGIGVLAGGIAHDFNNLLTGIIGNASLCQEMVNGDAELAERLGDVVQAGERAAELTSQLLAYAGKGRFVVRPIDVSALVAAIAPLVKRFIPPNSELRLDLGDDLPPTEGDSGQLQQVVMNLIINAGEAIPEGGAGLIRVSTGIRRLTDLDGRNGFVAATPVPGEYVNLEVRDTGSGMTDEVRERIFDPFFTTKFLGRGLGLAAVLGIVRSHNGALRVTSNVGEGTTFSVYLPVSRTPAQPAISAPEPVEKIPAEAGILVVDDEASIRSVATHALRRRGMRVFVARDGADAIEKFRQRRNQISVVVLDLTMQGIGGEQCYEALRKISADVRVILSSGFSEHMLHDRFAGRGFAGFLQKPYTSGQLSEKIAAVLARDGE